MSRLVLIVDDEPMARTMLRLILAGAGFEITEAQDGYEAIEAVNRDKPDLMILDIMMPGIDGFAVCEALRKDARWVEMAIIMLSAKADPESIERGLRLGATKYLTKPVKPDELKRHVREALKMEDEVSSS